MLVAKLAGVIRTSVAIAPHATLRRKEGREKGKNKLLITDILLIEHKGLILTDRCRPATNHNQGSLSFLNCEEEKHSDYLYNVHFLQVANVN